MVSMVVSNFLCKALDMQIKPLLLKLDIRFFTIISSLKAPYFVKFWQNMILIPRSRRSAVASQCRAGNAI